MVQAIIFKKQYWTPETCRHYLSTHKLTPIKRVHETANHYRYRIKEPNKNMRYVTVPSRTYPKTVKYVIEF